MFTPHSNPISNEKSFCFPPPNSNEESHLIHFKLKVSYVILEVHSLLLNFISNSIKIKLN